MFRITHYGADVLIHWLVKKNAERLSNGYFTTIFQMKPKEANCCLPYSSDPSSHAIHGNCCFDD